MMMEMPARALPRAAGIQTVAKSAASRAFPGHASHLLRITVRLHHHVVLGLEEVDLGFAHRTGRTRMIAMLHSQDWEAKMVAAAYTTRQGSGAILLGLYRSPLS